MDAFIFLINKTQIYWQFSLSFNWDKEALCVKAKQAKILEKPVLVMTSKIKNNFKNLTRNIFPSIINKSYYTVSHKNITLELAINSTRAA